MYITMVALWFISRFILREIHLLVGVNYIQEVSFYSYFTKVVFWNDLDILPNIYLIMLHYSFSMQKFAKVC